MIKNSPNNANASKPHTLPSRSSQSHQPKLVKECVFPNARTKRKHGHTTRGIKHWGLSGYANILPRIKFGVTGQVSSPQSPTISYRHPLAVRLKDDT